MTFRSDIESTFAERLKGSNKVRAFKCVFRERPRLFRIAQADECSVVLGALWCIPEKRVAI
jgi:hypothetical protein